MPPNTETIQEIIVAAIKAPSGDNSLSSPLNACEQDFRRALHLFKEAAARVPAYKDFLRTVKVNAASIKTQSDFAQVPLVDKSNYISKYTLPQLSWDGTVRTAKYISSSSGSTGIPFYWPRWRDQDVMTGRAFRHIYECIFDTKRGGTLFVNMFALGTWLAGLEFYEGAKSVADAGNEIVILTPGIEKTTAIDAIKRLAPSFDRTVLAGYPPFIKDVLEFGLKAGVDWTRMDIRLLTAGEAFSEMWRNRVLQIIGKEGSLSSVINVYGMAEAGVVAHETPLSIAARRFISQIPELNALLTHDGEVSPLFQYDPSTRYFEVAEHDSLVLTSDAGLPLIRYNTRDRGGLLQQATVSELLSSRLDESTAPHPLCFPFVYLLGRRDFSISLYALIIYTENIKQALQTSPSASLLSGLFTMRVRQTPELDQRFEITVELAPGTAPRAVHTQSLARHVVNVLCRVNAEYAKLRASIGKRALPHLHLVCHGGLDTVPGRKHKWVKRA